MARFSGFPGGGGMQNLMKQAQKMQAAMMKAKEELSTTEVTGQAGNGLVKVTITCDKNMVGISIDKKAVDMDDLGMLEDLIVVAYNDASDQAEEITEEKMGPFSQLM